MSKRETTAGQSDSGTASNHHPKEDDIAVRAYEIFMTRGATPGNDLDDWLQAERELAEKTRDSAMLRSMAIR